MKSFYDPKYEHLFAEKGGRSGKVNKAAARGRNGKYHIAEKYADKRPYRQRTETPKELTKAYSRLGKRLRDIENMRQEEEEEYLNDYLIELYQQREERREFEDYWIMEDERRR